jgi:hypothetical protein
MKISWKYHENIMKLSLILCSNNVEMLLLSIFKLLVEWTNYQIYITEWKNIADKIVFMIDRPFSQRSSTIGIWINHDK